MKQYLWAMGIRTLCFPLAVWAFTAGRYWLAGIAATGAALIPSFAVMFANAVDRRQQPDSDEVTSPTLRLGPGAGAAGADSASAPDAEAATAEHPGREQDAEAAPRPPDDPIQGTVVSSRDTAYPRRGEPGPDGRRAS